MGGSDSKTLSTPPFFVRGEANRDFKEVVEVTPGFFNIRADFIVKKVVNVGTHMSLARLSSGEYVAIDCAILSAVGKTELDLLTDNGRLLVAVLNTHPYHSVGIEPFHASYPSGPSRAWYGCPRHLRTKTQDAAGNPIIWAGDLETDEARAAFEPELSMRIPAGAEFNNPLPPLTNHFSNVFVLHRASKTVHNDDCVMFVDSPGFLRLAGYSSCSMHFHRSMKGPGLNPTKDAPLMFKNWLLTLLDEWDFNHIVTAHNGNCFCRAKEILRQTLANADKDLMELSKTNAKFEAEADWNLPHYQGARGEDCGWSQDENEVECG